MSPSNLKKLKSWSGAVLAFAVWAVLLDFLWTHIVIDEGATTEASRISHLIHEHGSEIPIFGASKAQDDYVPGILGDDVFNYGIDGGYLEATFPLLRIECEKPKTSPIILDISHHASMSIGDPSKFAPYASRPEVRPMLDRLGLMEWHYWIPGLRYFGYYDWYLKDYLAELISPTKKAARGQLVRLFPGFKPEELQEAVQKRLASGYGFNSFPDQDSQLYDIIKSAPQRTILIVFSPVHPSCFANFKDAEGFAQYVAKLRSFPNVVVLDWGQMKFPDEYFKDTLHLNEKGADAFSRLLAPQIQALRVAAAQRAQSPASTGTK